MQLVRRRSAEYIDMLTKQGTGNLRRYKDSWYVGLNDFEEVASSDREQHPYRAQQRRIALPTCGRRWRRSRSEPELITKGFGKLQRSL